MSTLEAKTSTAYIATGDSGPYYSVLGYGSIGLSVTGTFSAGTLKFQGSNDSVTWTDLQILQASTPVTNDEITAIGNYVCGIVSYQTVRLFVSGFTGSVVATASVSPQIVLPVISGGNEVVDSLTILGQQGALAADVNGLIYSAQGVSGDVMRQSGTGAGELDSVTWTGARYIAVGASGNIYTSTTGTGTWTRRTSGTASQFLSVTWNGSLAVAVGIGGVVATSADGITWTLRTSGTANNLASVTWDGTAFIVVGSVQTVITSPDGTTWTTRTFGTTTAIRGVASTSSLAVAVCASGIIKTSTDHGVTWTSRTSGVATTIWKVAVNAGGTLWTAVGASGVILTSPDGTTWTSRTSGAGTTTIENVTFGNSLWVAVGDSGFIATSPDGTTWTVRTSGTTQALYGLVYGVAWIAVGNAIKLSSPDAVTWSIVAQNVWIASTPDGTGPLLARDGNKSVNGNWTFGGSISAGETGALRFDGPAERLFLGNLSQLPVYQGANGSLQVRDQNKNTTVRISTFGDGFTGYLAFDQVGGTPASPTPVANNTVFGSIVATGNYGNPSVGAHGGHIDIAADGTWSVTNYGTKIDVYTIPNGSTTEVKTVSFWRGRVGILTDTPAAPLDVLGIGVVGAEANRTGATSGLNVIHNAADVFKITHAGVAAVAFEINTSPNRLDVLDVDNAVVPLSIPLDGSGGIKVSNGATGTFLSADAKTVTVTNGIITSIV